MSDGVCGSEGVRVYGSEGVCVSDGVCGSEGVRVGLRVCDLKTSGL